VSFFWVDAAPGAGPEFHRHPYTETWVVLGGRALVEADGESVVVREGHVATVGAGTVHRFRAMGEERLHMVCIHASPEIIQEFVDPSA
jgi:mannose-6-phosphate isomerase-like protein (cupin superfamily)